MSVVSFVLLPFFTMAFNVFPLFPFTQKRRFRFIHVQRILALSSIKIRREKKDEPRFKSRPQAAFRNPSPPFTHAEMDIQRRLPILTQDPFVRQCGRRKEEGYISFSFTPFFLPAAVLATRKIHPVSETRRI